MSSLMSAFQQYLPAVTLILLPNVGGFVNVFITGGEMRPWFNQLKKPALNPPDWVFGPVWNTIYLCMGVSSYLIFKEGGLAAQAFPLAVYGSQFVLNWIWSPIFFKFHRIDLALVDIVAMWGSIVATMVVFYPINRTAALLLLPHLGWVSFATYLNYAFWKLNGRGNQAIKSE